jgi:N-acyl homoserine lactone hydrolase
MFKNQSVELTIQNVPVKIHAISTGSVSVKTKFRERTKNGIFATLDFLLDRTFTEWMPIWVWVVEHPEGVFVIDTGENSKVNNPDYFKSSGWFANWFNKSQFKFQVTPEDELDQQLLKLNIKPIDVKAVILTHLHLDHIDGLAYFPETKILVHKEEWEHPYGDLPKLYPAWFKPELIELNEKYETFDKAYFLTKAKDFIALHTPGHTNGHQSLLLKTDQCDILFAGDVCYNENQFRTGRYAGVNQNQPKAIETYERIKSLEKLTKLIFLASHDSESANKLKQVVSPSKNEQIMSEPLF